MRRITFPSDLLQPRCFGTSGAVSGASSEPPPATAVYTQGPDSQPQPDTPKGVTTKYVLPPGKFYPGTPHNYQVYVPAQYDAQKPTPFMIFLDGGGLI